ncbi:MAG: methionyl-tRNA formyltransferase [Candidatus Moranbacteria bacterium]|nr:methionyl-tRNA formyltransferase [Candidatus Moranbacteria bacterium]
MAHWLQRLRAKFSQGIFNTIKATWIHKDAYLLDSIHDTLTRPVSSVVPKVRVVFMGTPKLSATILGALLERGYNIVGVVTKADKPVGREKELVSNPVKEMTIKHELPLLQPEQFALPVIEQLRALKPDLIIVAAYGKLLPQEVLSLPGFGCVNVHTSLLPKWRGASPIQNALLAGASQTGVTIMLMDSGMDTGDILTQRSLPIAENDTTRTLTEKLTALATDLLLETLPQFVERHITPTKQNHAEATLCQLIEREDGHIIWTDEAENIFNRYRALSPWPGIFAYWKKNDDHLRLKLISISYQKQNPAMTQPLGKVFEIGEKIGVQTTSGVIFLEEVQLEGKSALPIRDFLRGNEGLIDSLLE